MILGKELLEHGIEKDGLGLAIDPSGPYERGNTEKFYRSGIIARSFMHLVQRPWMLAGGTEVEPPVMDPGNGTSGSEGGGGVSEMLG